MTRDEHLQWCKDRALEYIEVGKLQQAFVSMMSDLGKHEKLANHMGIKLGTVLFFNGHLNTKQEMKKFIEDFN